MANTIGTRPIYIDTPGASVLFNGRMNIKELVWANYTADAHTVEVQNSAGAPVFSSNGKADLSAIRVSPGWIDGLIVPTLDSGQLFIYLK
jgi:hypothetical protein